MAEPTRISVSTGAKGHDTPTGVFTILEKNITLESSLYKGAEMPHMERLTWGGIAMHTGQLPGSYIEKKRGRSDNLIGQTASNLKFHDCRMLVVNLPFD